MTLQKVARSRHIRLRIQPDGAVLVTMPSYVPFGAALKYAEAQADWILENRTEQPEFTSGDKLGIKYYFEFVPRNISRIATRRVGHKLVINYPSSMSVKDLEVQEAARKLALRALKKEAEEYLPDWLKGMATEHGFSYNSAKVKQLRSRWGSCSSQRDIVLNIFLMKLPDELIEYVLAHELTHLKHMNHSAAFWATLSEVVPDAKARRKALKEFKPAL